MLQKIAERLYSLEEELLKLTAEVEENHRAASNIIRLGVVEKTNANTVKVKTGKNFADNIPFLVLAAGRVSQYRRPSKGEQCLLLNLGSGDNLNNAVALMGLPSTLFPSPSTDENIVFTDYGNGMTERYDLAAGSLNASYPGGCSITGNINHIGNVVVTGDVSAAGDIKAADISLTGHHHTDAEGRDVSIPK